MTEYYKKDENSRLQKDFEAFLTSLENAEGDVQNVQAARDYMDFE